MAADEGPIRPREGSHQEQLALAYVDRRRGAAYLVQGPRQPGGCRRSLRDRKRPRPLHQRCWRLHRRGQNVHLMKYHLNESEFWLLIEHLYAVGITKGKIPSGSPRRLADTWSSLRHFGGEE